MARLCRAREGFGRAPSLRIKNLGTILLQQTLRRKMPARAINSKLTAMGKDERAISVSGYVHRGLVQYTDRAFEKTVIYKRYSRNHLLDQVGCQSSVKSDPRSASKIDPPCERASAVR